LDTANQIDLLSTSTPSDARTLVFTGIVLFELVFAFVCEREKPSLRTILSNKKLLWAGAISLTAQILVVYTPFMQRIFKTTPLSLIEWIVLFALACTAFLVPPLTKAAKKFIKK
jgi:Ca2+-transporting ATPase